MKLMKIGAEKLTVFSFFIVFLKGLILYIEPSFQIILQSHPF